MNIHTVYKTLFATSLFASIAICSCHKEKPVAALKDKTYSGELYYHQFETGHGYPDRWDSSQEKITVNYLNAQSGPNQKISITTTSSLGEPLNNDTLYYYSGSVDSTTYIWGGSNESEYFLTHYNQPDKIVLNGCIGCSLGSSSIYSFTGTP